MNSDSLFVQEYTDSKLMLKYISKAPETNNSEQNSSKIKTDSFWSWLGEVFAGIGSFFNNLAYFMGLPIAMNTNWYSNACYNQGGTGGYGCHNNYDWLKSALGSMGDAFVSDGGGGFSYGDYSGEEFDPYKLYLPGPNDPSTLYPPFSSIIINDPTHGPYININPVNGSYEAQELIAILNLSRFDGKLVFYLQDHNNVSLQMRNYLSAYGETQENKDFIKWSVGYLADNSAASSYLTDHPEDFELFVMNDIDLNEPDDIAMATNAADIITDILVNRQNGTLNNLDVSWPSANDIKSKITSAISKGVYTTAKYARNYLYLPLQKVSLKYPSTINYSNKVIDAVRIDAVTPLVNFNANTMSWGDLFNTWLFELAPGHFSNNTINFTLASNVVNGYSISNPATNAVMNFPKGNNAQGGNLLNIQYQLQQGLGVGQNAIQGYFRYDVNAFYSTLSDANLGIQMLGSFPINATVISKSGNTAVVQFQIINDLGWESGTRFIKGTNGNQGIIDNKPVGTGLHLGGTITNTFTWTETIFF